MKTTIKRPDFEWLMAQDRDKTDIWIYPKKLRVCAGDDKSCEHQQTITFVSIIQWGECMGDPWCIHEFLINENFKSIHSRYENSL
jgi:hypothetical protein